MCLRKSRPAILKLPGTRLLGHSLVSFRSFSQSRLQSSKNQVYTSVRRPEDLHTYLLLSSSSRTPLLTLWTASYCPTCRQVAPLIRSLIESGIGEAEGGVGYCTVEYDSPDIMTENLGMRYMINSLPTLLSFDAQEPQTQTKVTESRRLVDRSFLEEWIRTEARRRGNRGGGKASFGGLFGNWK